MKIFWVSYRIRIFTITIWQRNRLEIIHFPCSVPYVTEDQHVYEVIELASRLSLSIVPVLSNNSHYKGVITQNDLIHYFADFSALKEPGAIIILEMSIHDYSLSQISQIVESNDAKILSLYISSHSSSTRLELTLKDQPQRSDLYNTDIYPL